MANPQTTFHRLRDDLMRFYDTPYRLRLEGVMAERRSIVDRAGGAWQEPWVEVIRPYDVTGLGLDEAIKSAGGSDDLLSSSSAVCWTSMTSSFTSKRR